jgi:fatty-acid desaturase
MVVVRGPRPRDRDRPRFEIRAFRYFGSNKRRCGLCHAIALVGPFVVRFSWGLVGLAAILYEVQMCLLSAGYHRYFAHRAFKTSGAFQLCLAVAGGTCTAGSALVGGQPAPPPRSLR